MSGTSTAKVGRSDASRRLVTLLVVGTLATILLLTVTGPVQAEEHNVTITGNETVSPEMVESQPPAPEEDRLGWENGVWYNATLAVDQSDGIDEAELRALTARTQARLEHIRGLEFERTPPIRVITRDQQRDESGELVNVTDDERLAFNVRYESLLLINESTDAVESQQSLFGSSVGGYYSPGGLSITMVSVPGDELRVDEGTLSQELFHAQQDQKFNLSSSTPTIEARNARNSVVEGDANYVEYLYRQRCEGSWTGSCYIPETEQQNQEQPPELNFGMLQLFLNPYQSGVSFVRERRQSGGWDAVDELYEQYPASTEQAIHPEKYPDEVPTELTVPDRSSDEWEPLTVNGTRANGTVGEAGLYVALWYPSLESQGVASIIPLRNHIIFNQTTGDPAQPVAYNYDHEKTAGWDGDKMVPYVSEDADEPGYVYETAWDSEEAAETFASAYVDLLEYHDATEVSDRADTYRIESGGFADAFYVHQNGTRVTIVNAPSVEQLREIRPDAAPAGEMTDTGTATATPADSGSDGTTSDGTESDGTESDDSSGAIGPGFGLLATLLAVVTVLVVSRRR